MARWFPTTSNAEQDHPFCNNANAAIRRSVWEKLPYDEELTGLEDVEWAKRAMENGHAIAYVATAPVTHLHEETWGQLVNRYRREAIAYKSIFPDQKMSALHALRLAVGNVASDYLHAVRDRVLIRGLSSIPAFRSAQFWGTYRGFRQKGEASADLRRHFYYPNGWRRGASPELPSGRRIDYDDGRSDADVQAD